MFFLWP